VSASPEEVAMPIEPIALFLALPIAGLVAFGVYFIRASMRADSAPVRSRDASEELSGKSKIGFYAACILMALVYILAGSPKVGGFDSALHSFHRWGYTDTFLYTIGILEFIGGILLLIPKVRFYAAVYLGMIMSGAIYTHLAFDAAYIAIVPAICLALLAFIAYESAARGELRRAA
jgi:uncharacterized membrane protein YphA (DoxX/SURF4 family)